VALQRVADDLAVPTLDGFGVDEAVFRRAVPAMADDALASGSPGNNPIVPDKAQIEALYHRIWDEGVQRENAA
jgi:alcohol dehydrogenase class IV